MVRSWSQKGRGYASKEHGTLRRIHLWYNASPTGDGDDEVVSLWSRDSTREGWHRVWQSKGDVGAVEDFMHW